mgnify:CR=1 FL=1
MRASKKQVIRWLIVGAISGLGGTLICTYLWVYLLEPLVK